MHQPMSYRLVPPSVLFGDPDFPESSAGFLMRSSCFTICFARRNASSPLAETKAV
jgi:hypothetical protein